MKATTLLVSPAVLAIALCMICALASAEAPREAAAVPKPKDKMLRIPLGHKPHGKRADSSSSASPTESSSAPSSKSSKPSATPTDSVSEEGTLEADQSEETESSATKNNGGGTENHSNAEVVTDAQGNPIVTDLNVSHWEMITPTGVLYVSGASRHVPGAAAAWSAAGVALAAAAMF
ncbi:hypothetical protein GGI23_005999 [Coemansia sp. RSA 2559]|nr:hypothetical protein GGI23_005999 [Coemansia sp. RSA 2559]KAJ2861667.1 hypothetical protein GGI22_002400 [Coemansia erecta]